MNKPKPIVFPRDHQAHDNIIEWWYFNGLLKDKSGQKYSFMDCLFKADLKKVGIPFLKRIPFKKITGVLPYVYFAHSVISDISNQKNYKEIQNISLVSRDSFTKPLLFINYISPMILGGYTNNEMTENSPNNFHIKTSNLNLQLASRKSPLLEGGVGYISVCDRESYYYSLTDLQVTGQIVVEGKTIEVEGKAWMDHQWADVSFQKDKWTWFSLQLDNGTDIMCVEYDDGKRTEYLVDTIDRTGASTHFKKLILTPGQNTWRSKKTKTEFPTSWDIYIPDLDTKLSVKSIMSDQEMIFGNINYWEGPLAITGTMRGQSVTGNGFMELVGYPSNYNYLYLTGKELNHKFWASFK